MNRSMKIHMESDLPIINNHDRKPGNSDWFHRSQIKNIRHDWAKKEEQTNYSAYRFEIVNISDEKLLIGKDWPYVIWLKPERQLTLIKYEE